MRRHGRDAKVIRKLPSNTPPCPDGNLLMIMTAGQRLKPGPALTEFQARADRDDVVRCGAMLIDLRRGQGGSANRVRAVVDRGQIARKVSRNRSTT